jgi:hypothetical protein
MPQNVEKYSVYEDRKRQVKETKKKLKILLVIGILLITLFGIVMFAALRQGGIGNLIKGDGNPITNTINNIGTSFVEPSPTKQPQVIGFPDTPADKKEVTKEQFQNFVTFDTLSPGGYDITIKKGTFVYFSNKMEARVGLKFSDGRELKLNAQESANLMFPNPGTFTFNDLFVTQGEPISGTVRVVNE